MHTCYAFICIENDDSFTAESSQGSYKNSIMHHVGGFLGLRIAREHVIASSAEQLSKTVSRDSPKITAKDICHTTASL